MSPVNGLIAKSRQRREQRRPGGASWQGQRPLGRPILLYRPGGALSP